MKNKITSARFVILEGRPVSIKESLIMGEYLRASIMGLAKQVIGGAQIPWEISGHNTPEGNKHEHFFYLPEDSKGEGTIDSLFIYCKKGLSLKLRHVLQKLLSMKGKKGESWSLVLENFGSVENFSAYSTFFKSSFVWRSCTPYFHPWHLKKHFSLFDQIRKECALRGLPEISHIKLIPYLSKGESRFYPPHFYKFRSKKNVGYRPDIRGGFWQLTFKNLVQGPLALGFDCHFGLGLFEAVDLSKVNLIKEESSKEKYKTSV